MIQLNLIEIFSIIIIHWFADFVLQTDKQAKGKSKNWEDLLGHTGIYSIMWTIPMTFLLYNENSIKWWSSLSCFILITFICHTITDYFTSRLNSKLWAKATHWGSDEMKRLYPIDCPENKHGKYIHNFFVSVGFDQVLHYVQLFLTYALLKQYL